jgi:hypothetical protein
VRTPADLLAGCSGTEWNPKDPVALITDYRCCSEGMWRDRMDPDGRPLGLLITQRSRVQIPPPPPLTTRAFATSGGRPSGSLRTRCSRLAHVGRRRAIAKGSGGPPSRLLGRPGQAGHGSRCPASSVIWIVAHTTQIIAVRNFSRADQPRAKRVTELPKTAHGDPTSQRNPRIGMYTCRFEPRRQSPSHVRILGRG